MAREKPGDAGKADIMSAIVTSRDEETIRVADPAGPGASAHAESARLGFRLTLPAQILVLFIAVFPLPLVWFAWIALAGGGRMARWWLAVLVAANLTLSAGFLHYIHVHGGAPRGDYGVTWRMQSQELPPTSRP